MQTAGETTLIKKNPPSVDDKKKGKDDRTTAAFLSSYLSSLRAKKKRCPHEEDNKKERCWPTFPFLFFTPLAPSSLLANGDEKKMKRKGAQDLKYWPAACFVMAGQ